jgi:hypothetical protein
MEVGPIHEESVAFKTSSDYVLNPDRPKWYSVSNQRGMEQATKPRASNVILIVKSNDNILLRGKVKGSPNEVTAG